MLSSQHSLSKQSFSTNKKLENNNFLFKNNREPEYERPSYYSTFQQYFNLSNFFQNKEKESFDLPKTYSSDEDQECYFTPQTTFSSSVHSLTSKGINPQELESKLIEEKKLLDNQYINEKFKASSSTEGFNKTNLCKNLKNVASTSNSTFDGKANKSKILTEESCNTLFNNRVPFFLNFSRKQSFVSNGNFLNTENPENDMQYSTKSNFDNQYFVNKKQIMPVNNSIPSNEINIKSDISNLNQGFQTNSTSSINSINSSKSNLLLHQEAHNANSVLPLTKYTFGGDTALPAGTSPLALQNKSLSFSNSKILNKKSSSQNFLNFNVNSKNKRHLVKESSSPLISSRSRLALDVLNASRTAMVPSISHQSAAFNNIFQNSKGSSIVSSSINNNSVGKVQNGFQQQILEPIKLRGGFEPHHLEPLQRHRGELSVYEKYRYDLSRAQLKATSRTSALLSGFAMVALVELQYFETTPKLLLITLGVVTSLLVSVHLLALMMSTCLLPYIEANGCTQDSPHIKLRFYIELSWFFSTCIGLLLFLLEVGLIFFVKFNAINYDFAGYITTMILFPVAIIFIVISYLIHRSRFTHSIERVNDKVVNLQKFLTESDGTSTSNQFGNSIHQNAVDANLQTVSVLKGFKNV